MITEDKVTEIFCVADDFCKFFDTMMARHTIRESKKRSHHCDSTLSKAEVMLIMILFHDSGYRCLKHFYLYKVCKHMRRLFQQGGLYNCFVELERKVAIPFAMFIKKVLLGKCTGISFVDGIQLITKLRNNMKGALMSISDKLLLRKRAIIETINDELKKLHRWNTQGTEALKISS